MLHLNSNKPEATTTTSPSKSQTVDSKQSTAIAIVPTETSTKAEETTEKKGENAKEEGDEEDIDEDVSKNDEQVKAKADEISNLQRSWEMFELAELIYSEIYSINIVQLRIEKLRAKFTQLRTPI